MASEKSSFKGCEYLQEKLESEVYIQIALVERMGIHYYEME